MKSQLPPLRVPSLHLLIVFPSPSLPYLITVAAVYLPPPLHPTITSIQPLFPLPVLGAACAEQIVCGVVSLFNSPHLTYTS